jgi:Domain of unknown function (DUF4386)
MTFADSSSPRKRASMDPTRKTALVAGILYLITYASSIPAALLLGATLDTPNYILGAGDGGQIRLAALFDIVNGLTAFGTAVALYSVLRRQHEGFAIGFVAARLFEAAILFVGILSVVTIANLRDAGVAGADPASLGAVGTGLVGLYKTSFVLGTGIPALNAALLGWLLYRSGLVPRAISVIGLIGAATFTSYLVGYVMGVTAPGTPWQAIGVAPIFIWELVLGLWMTFKGFQAPAVAALYAETATDADRTMPVATPAAMATKAGAA